jgi:type VI secretion system protein ImpI
MSLKLTISNQTELSDGGPLSVSVTPDRGIDIGRDPYLDWVLPDPTRFVSGKHCEVRHRDGGYWLADVSTNGTYINGSDTRPAGPHRLKHGDRIEIGRYTVDVEIAGASADETSFGAAGPAAETQSKDSLWSTTSLNSPRLEERFAPEPPVSARPVMEPDSLDWASDIPILADAWGSPASSVAALAPVVSHAEPQSAPMPSPSTPAPVPGYTPTQATSVDSGDFVGTFCRAAGLPPQALAQIDGEALARQLGELMLMYTSSLHQLVAARAASKGALRSSRQTMVQAFDNNPLRFAPTPEDALKIMLGPPTKSYLSGSDAVKRSFDDVKAHQIDMLAAMQKAAERLIADLDPSKADDKQGASQGLMGLVGNAKGRAYDQLLTRWDAKTKGRDRGALDLFMDYFAQAYDKGPKD